MAIRVKLPNGEIGEFPDDMSHEDIESVLQKQFPPEQQSEIAATPFNESQQQPEEKIDSKSVMSDLVHGLGKALRQGTDFAVKTPGMITSLAKHLKEHPLSALKHDTGQLLAGAGDTAKDVANTGLSLGSWALKQLDPVGSSLMERSGKSIEAPQIPEDTGVEKFLGLEPTQKEDRLIRAIPEIYGAGKLLVKPITTIAKAFKSPDLKKAIKETQAKVNAVDKKMGKNFDKVEEAVEKRGVTPIPVDKETMTAAKRFLDKSPETKALIADAEKGDYKALRKIQADLRVIGEDALSNKLSTERKIGKEALSTRKKINNDIENHFENTGHKDLADLLKETKEGYKELQDVYFSSPALARVFGKSQKVPKNPLSLLSEDSTEMNKFMSAHPEVKEALAKALKHKKNMKRLGKAATVVTGGGIAGGTYKALGGK